MTLQDWFYILGIVYFVSWIGLLVVIGSAIIVVVKQLRQMQQQAAYQVQSVKNAVQNFPLIQLSSATTLLPVAAWLFKKMRKKS